jgi:hypothetical protein
MPITPLSVGTVRARLSGGKMAGADAGAGLACRNGAVGVTAALPERMPKKSVMLRRTAPPGEGTTRDAEDDDAAGIGSSSSSMTSTFESLRKAAGEFATVAAASGALSGLCCLRF